MKLKPVNDKIVVKPEPKKEDERTASGIILPDSAESGGLIQGTLISCPLHGAVFDLKTGEVMSPPAFEDLKTFKLKIEGTSIKVLKPET